MDNRMTVINEAVQYLEGRLGGLRPQIGIILGSGLGKLADRIGAPLTIPYTDVPGFVKSTAIGHTSAGRPSWPCRAASTTTRAIPWTR